MTGTVELDQDGAFLLLRFPYREDLVAAVKLLPGRRWDPKHKVWRVPASAVDQVYELAARNLFDLAPEVSSLLAGTLGKPTTTAKKTTSTDGSGDAGALHPAAAPLRQLRLPEGQPGSPSAASEPTTDALTISALNQAVRDALKREFPRSLWVVGEIVDYDKSAGRQHRFFQLVEKAKGQPRPLAVVEVALFERTAQRLLQKLARGDDPLTLRDGIEIRALVSVDIYVGSGRYQIVVEDIDPSFTLGKMALSREQILRELRDKGLVDTNRSRGVPMPPLRVGVLTSPDSDGWNDFLRHLQEARLGFALTLVPIKVQGAELRPSLLAGLQWFAHRHGQFDVLCILRGGGSRSDLAWFDDREIAFAVARHPLKILVGIGHQRDQSVLDHIAHSEKTPTAVAGFLVGCVQDTRAALAEQAQRLRDDVQELLARAATNLGRRARDLQFAVDQRLRRETHALANSARDLHARALLRLQRADAHLRAGQARLDGATSRRLDRTTAVLEQQATRLRLLDPQRVLGRGFALVRSVDGKVLPAAERIRANQTIVVQFRDGRVRGRADSIELEP